MLKTGLDLMDATLQYLLWSINKIFWKKSNKYQD